MENLYTAYTKQIENQTFFFVKKFMAFPEFQNVDPVLESYGMHADFKKACSIAGVYDAEIREKLLKEAEETMQTAKVIDLNTISFSGQNLAM